jgi:hypothetical protein
LVASAGLLFALPAAAHGDRWDGPRWSNQHHGKAWGHAKHRHGRYERHVVRERVVVRHPVVRERYYAPPVSYAYSRSPSIVIGVSIPPLVIPLR